ncbi:MAG: acyl carrier protein [Dehalococcoidia bacterium]|nr:acyl carrier protein [Dehalococcoidia bacterium]
MKIERQKILELVYASIEPINEQRESKDDKLELEEETHLFGRESKLDSLGLVTLIIDIEQSLVEELGLEVSLTDEKAMSQERSPFRDVKSLVDYICSLEV